MWISRMSFPLHPLGQNIEVGSRSYFSNRVIKPVAFTRKKSLWLGYSKIKNVTLTLMKGTAILNKTLAFESTALSTQRNYYAASDASDLNVDYCTHATPNGPWETYDYSNAA